jgi:hypothetical protein
VKNVEKAVAAGDKAKATDLFAKAQSIVDTVADKGIFHKNKAARDKSRLSAKVKDRGRLAPRDEHLRPAADRAGRTARACACGTSTASATSTRWPASPSTRWATTTPSWCPRCRTRSQAHPQLQLLPRAQPGKLAAKLVQLSGMTNVFFCSTGLEANEAAIKLARKFGHDKGIERPEIVVYEKAFHGRSIATLSPPATRRCRRASARWSRASSACR